MGHTESIDKQWVRWQGDSSVMCPSSSQQPVLPHSPPLTHRAIFDVLYTLLGYGHDSEASLQKLDPPDDFFRLRMVSRGGASVQLPCEFAPGAGHLLA